jgi:hypothetical protein
VIRSVYALQKQRRLLWLAVLLLILAASQSCSPAVMPTSPAEEQPAPNHTQVPQAAASPVYSEPTATLQSNLPTAQPGEPVVRPVVEDRSVELEWPAQLRMGESDVIRLALVPVKDGYVAQAEFPDHNVQSKPVAVPRQNGYTLFGLARLDGVGFEIAPTGEQERFIPEGEEVAWRWTLSPRQPGKQRLSVNLRLRWEPAAGTTGIARESQAFSRGLDVQVRSFLGMSPTQAASAGVLGLLGGCACLLAAFAAGGRPRKAAAGGASALQVARPNPKLRIETPPGLTLAEEEDGLLRGLFAGYDRLAIENEFLSGYSGARTFLVQPIRADGRSDAPTIVKLGPRQAIRQEFDNYENFVKDRLPPVTARIQRPPVIMDGDKSTRYTRAAVQYTFIAEPGRPPVSLRRALLDNPDPALLLRLFETFGPNWWMQRSPYTFRAGLEYDRLLPPHYVLEPLTEPAHKKAAHLLDESCSPNSLSLTAGDVIHLRPFRRAELRPDGHSFALSGAAAAGQPALRLRWMAARAPASVSAARVAATRMDLLRGWTANFDHLGLADPLALLPRALEETLSGTRSVIHGDLNLENVLAGPGGMVWLIDFAETGEGHPLSDFAHLESELIAHILAPRCGSASTYLALWQSGDDPLLRAMHAIAGRCLFDPARPREYQLALYLACLGALKYQNLDGLAKHCLFLTAGALAGQLARE